MTGEKSADTGASQTLRFNDGRVIMFGIEEFAERICRTDCCFLCGENRGSKPFNDEHIIPRWALKNYRLFDKKITLPNDDEHQYGTYTLPCCANCNSLLGSRVEAQISELMTGGFDALSEKLASSNPEAVGHILALYIWLCLLFTKTHLKDRYLRQHRDFRLGDASIADEYDWKSMHHIYCVARAPYVGGQIDAAIIGTIQWYKMEDASNEFDYFDLIEGKTIALKLGDIGIVAVLGDSGACAIAWKDILERAQGQTLTIIQLRELAARLAVAHRDLINNPRYFTTVDRSKSPPDVCISVEHDLEPHFQKLVPTDLGEVMHFALRRFIGSLQVDGFNDVQSVSDAIKTGAVSFVRW